MHSTYMNTNANPSENRIESHASGFVVNFNRFWYTYLDKRKDIDRAQSIISISDESDIALTKKQCLH